VKKTSLGFKQNMSRHSILDISELINSVFD
jgi:hypothetical protein